MPGLLCEPCTQAGVPGTLPERQNKNEISTEITATTAVM